MLDPEPVFFSRRSIRIMYSEGLYPDPIFYVPNPPLWKEQGLELGIYGICINIEKITNRRAIFLKKLFLHLDPFNISLGDGSKGNKREIF